MYFVVERDRF